MNQETPHESPVWRVVEVVYDDASRELRRVGLGEHEDEESAVAAVIRARDARARDDGDLSSVQIVIEHLGREIDVEDAVERLEPE